MPLTSHKAPHQSPRPIPLLGLLIIALLSLQGCTAILVGGTVGVAASVATDRRPASTIVEDQAIEIKVTDSIYSDRVLGKEVNISVTCYNGVVLLTGQAPTEALRLRAGEIAKPLRNVRKVYNEVRVIRRQSFFEDSHDAWLTSKVKTRLMRERGLPTHTKVVSANGIVYLMGLVDQQEAEEAYRIAEDMRDVEDIVALFERTDLPEDSAERFSRTAVKTTRPAKPKVQPKSSEEDDLDVLPFTLQPTADMPVEEE